VTDEIKKLERERDYWKRVAAYLASCHAATLSSEGVMKRTSRSSRDRFWGIVEIARDMMDGKDWRAGSSYAYSTPESAMKHCDEALVYFLEETK
jgi:hypothetical protein